MKLKNKGFIIVLTALSAIVASCGTSADAVSATSEKRETQSNNEEMPKQIRYSESAQNKTNRISELKIVQPLERPGQ